MAVLALAGTWTLTSDSQQVTSQLDELLLEGKLRVIFDLSGLDYIDSGGVGTVEMCFGKLKTSGGGTLRVAGAAGRVEHAFKVTNVHRVIQFYPTVEAAGQSFANPSASRTDVPPDPSSGLPSGS